MTLSVVVAGYDNRPSSYHTDRALQRYFFDMRSESLPAEAETVTGAVLRVYKFPAYVNMAVTGKGHAHHTRLVLHVSTLGDDVTRDWSVLALMVSSVISCFYDRCI